MTIPVAAVPLTKDLVFTDQEESKTLSTIAAFNAIIAQVAADYGLPLVDVNTWMQPGGGPPLPNDSCLGFALVSRVAGHHDLQPRRHPPEQLRPRPDRE